MADLTWCSYSFIPTVSGRCPFYDLRETSLHVFSECERLFRLFHSVCSF